MLWAGDILVFTSRYTPNIAQFWKRHRVFTVVCSAIFPQLPSWLKRTFCGICSFALDETWNSWESTEISEKYWNFQEFKEYFRKFSKISLTFLKITHFWHYLNISSPFPKFGWIPWSKAKVLSKFTKNDGDFPKFRNRARSEKRPQATVIENLYEIIMVETSELEYRNSFDIFQKAILGQKGYNMTINT